MKPLYILAQEKKLEKIQMMDLETLNWLYTKQKIYSINFNKVCSKIPKISKTLLFEHQVIESNFLKKEKINSIHGLRHMLRVQIYSLIICKMLNYDLFVREILIAGCIHDIRRINDKEDVAHGCRAAEWYKNNYFDSSLNIDLVYNLTKFHDVEYSKIPEYILNEYESEMKIFKISDALDRFRLPKEKWWPNKEYLLLDLNYDLLFDFVKFFTYNTEKLALINENDFKEIINFCSEYNLFENEKN